jgi:hypothetical protein
LAESLKRAKPKGKLWYSANYTHPVMC